MPPPPWTLLFRVTGTGPRVTPRGEDESLTVGATGGDEVVVVPWPLLLRHRVVRRIEGGERYRWWILWSVLGGLFSVYVVFTLIAVSLPRIAAELGSSTSTMTWVITGPLLVIGVTAPVSGKLGDVYGHRRLFLTGLSGSAVFAVVSALAPTAATLIAARMLAAVLGGAAGSACMALIFASFPPHDRVKAMGFWSLVGAGAPVIGAAVGGPVVEAVGWRWVFAAQAPLVAVAVAVAAMVLPETPRSEARRIDWPGIALVTAAALSLLFALNRGPVFGWSHPLVLVAFVVAPVAVVAFAAVERRTDAPLIPLEYLRRRNFVFPVGAMAFAQFAYMGGFILSPLMLAGPMFDYGESRIGLVVLSRPLAFSLTAPVAGYVAVRLGERPAAVTGTLALVASMVLFSTVDSGEVATVVLGLVFSGMALGIASPSLASSVANTVADEDLGIAGAAQQLLTQVGVVAGIQLMQTVQASRLGTVGLEGSYSAAFLVGTAAAAVAVLCAAFVRSTDRGPGRAEGAANGALEGVSDSEVAG